MISSFTVGSVFKIIDEASPALRKILAEVRQLNLALDQARKNLAEVGKFAMPAGLTAAVGETSALGKAWKDVAANAAAANRAIGSASRTAARTALPAAVAAVPAAAAAATGGGGGGGRHRPGWLGGGGGAHVYGPGVGLPGGSHVRLGGAAMVGAGALGYGVVQAADMEKAAWWVTYHAHEQQTEANHAKFRKIIGDAMIDTGFSMKDVAEAATDAIRQFQATPVAGDPRALAIALRVAAKEALSKGSGLKESMASFTALTHMTGGYTVEDIEKLAPAFAALSTADPRSLTSMTRAAGYAVPLLHSALEIDPLSTLALGTALAGAGALSTKSGTWTRQMMTGAMPGTSMMSKFRFHKHEAGLKALGLVDDKGQPTWFTEGKPDPLKMLDIGGARLARIPLKERAGMEQAAFGTQGSEGFAMLSNKAVLDRVHGLVEMMKDPTVKAHYMSLLPDLQAGSTVQNARSTLQEFNVTMSELARMTLPSVNVALGGFKSTLEGIRSILPGGTGKSAAVIGGSAILGAVAGAGTGATIGAFGGPIGLGAGAIGGAAIGGVGAVAEQYMQNLVTPTDRFGREVFVTGNSAAQAAEGMKALGDAIRGLPAKPGSVFPGGTSAAPVPPIHLNLMIDGRALATAVSEQQSLSSTYQTDTPASNGAGLYGP